VYNAVATKLWMTKVGGWRRKLWRWDCPLKIKLCTWLVAENKILTWKNLQKRGCVGPEICFLCKGSRERGKHLFANCPFTIAVWNRVKIALNLPSGWTGQTLNKYYENWTKMNPSFPTLHAFLCWYIWNETNITIFEADSPSFQNVVYKAIGAVSIYGIKAKNSLPRIVHVHLPVDRAITWFDGAMQQCGEKCGVGGKIMINSNTSFLWTFNCG